MNDLTKKDITSLVFEIVIKVAILGVILYYAIGILKPFLIPVLWGTIIAVAFYPLIVKLEKRFSGKKTVILTLFAVLTIGSLLVPTYILSESMIESSQELALGLEEGTIIVPPASENVKEWPLIGEKTYNLWNSAANNLENTLITYKPQIAEYVPKIASSIGGILSGVLMFIISLLIATLFLAKSENSVKMIYAVSQRLVGEKGVEWANLSALTVRSVVQGVIGIAFIQSALSFVGLVLIDVPLPWLWALVVLMLAIVQLPPIIILGPIIAYVFSYADTTPATIFAIYAVIVGASDGFLKPLLLGRGVDIPMVVILLGAIGGLMLFGALGLFVGSVGLALAYKLFIVWLDGSIDNISQKA